MMQNIYDNEEFFEKYSQLSRSVEGLDGAPEWPALRALLPDLQGRKVLDLGCGFGWFCRWARQNGAVHVVGIDVSARMLTRAKVVTRDAAIAYTKADMEQLQLAPASFDLVYSSLALHYVKRLNELLSEVHRSLVLGGNLVFSVEHPIYTAPANASWLLNAEGRKSWPVDGYLDEGPRSTNWLTRGVIKQHRTLATYVNALIRLGPTLRSGGQPKSRSLRGRTSQMSVSPPFLLVAARRPAEAA
jgi:ubiquinone/menaquinone biosynthesis C-methylase UbiE